MGATRKRCNVLQVRATCAGLLPADSFFLLLPMLQTSEAHAGLQTLRSSAAGRGLRVRDAVFPPVMYFLLYSSCYISIPIPLDVILAAATKQWGNATDVPPVPAQRLPSRVAAVRGQARGLPRASASEGAAWGGATECIQGGPSDPLASCWHLLGDRHLNAVGRPSGRVGNVGAAVDGG